MNTDIFSTYTCIYAHYNQQQKVSKYVLTFLKSLADINCRIIFVSSSPIDTVSENALTTGIPDIQIYKRENKGYHFGAWKWALENVALPENTSHLILANDSFIGPITDLRAVMQQMHIKNAGFWGMTDAFEKNWYLHSYFMVFSEEVFNSKSFKQFFQQNNRDEQALSKTLTDNGFSGIAYIPYQNVEMPDPNNTAVQYADLFIWKDLIVRFGYPFIQKDLILYNPDNLENAGINIFSFLQAYPQYDIENVLDLIESACRPANNIQSQAKISVICHLYYPHTIFPFLIKLSKLKSYNAAFIINLSSSLYINTLFCDLLRRIFPNAILLYIPPAGRDIGAKMAMIDVLLKNNIDSDYTLVIHDKLSPHTPLGSNWRDQLLEIIEEEKLPLVLEKFQKNETTGIVTAGNYIKNEFDIDTKEFRCSSNTNLLEIIKKYELNINNYNYAAGTIFWIRTAILKGFFGLHQPLEIRKTLEKGNVLDFANGTNVHAWERTFSFITNHMGYKTTGL